MCALIVSFEDRLAEIDSYLDFLRTLESQSAGGPPRLVGAAAPISVTQQKILYSSVYLQLYNLVESTVSHCIGMVASATARDARWRPKDLSEEMLREWVRSIARTHVDMAPENRLAEALAACRHIIDSLPVSEFSIEKGGGGNWDDESIEVISRRLGCRLDISAPVYSDVKRKFRDDLGPLVLIRKLRNRLAHGDISFAESAEGVTVGQLVDLRMKAASYLTEVLACFRAFVENHLFLVPDRRPSNDA